MSFMPAFAANMLLDVWGVTAGQSAHVTSTFAEITGTTARAFQDWVRDQAADVRA